MSVGTRLKWQHAYDLGKEAAEHLQPHVMELKCVGSVRRKRPEVGDIEFVCRPQMQADLVGDESPVLETLEKALAEIGTRVKGAGRMIQMTDLFGLAGLKLDLYVCWPPASFGSLVAIRTGPWELSKYAVTMLHQNGYRHVDGHVERKDTGEIVPTDTEEQFFELAGIPCVPPLRRDALVRELLAGQLQEART